MGLFIGAAHRQCNIEHMVNFKILMFFHYFSGYNAHLIVHKFGKRPDREIEVIESKHKKVFPGRVWKEHGLPRLAPILACFPGAACGFACQSWPRIFPKSPRRSYIYVSQNKRWVARAGKSFCYDYLESLARLDEPALPPQKAFLTSSEV